MYPHRAASPTDIMAEPGRAKATGNPDDSADIINIIRTKRKTSSIMVSYISFMPMWSCVLFC